MFVRRFTVVASVAFSLCALAVAADRPAESNRKEETAKSEKPAANSDKSVSKKASSVADRAACSSLCQVKQPLEKALKTISDMGYKYVDLSCLNWPPSPPHVNVADLTKDFDKEATRVEAALKANKLKVSNLTFDGLDAAHFDDYTKRFELVMRLAARLHTHVVNIMSPANKADHQEMAMKLKKLQEVAAKHKIQLTLETHCGQVTELPADAVWFCKQVPGLGLTLDPSHFYAGPNQGKSFDEVYPYVKGTGLRAGGMSWKEIQMPWGAGPMDFTAIVHKLQANGYKGYYVSEYIEGFNQLNAVEQSQKFLDWARQVK